MNVGIVGCGGIIDAHLLAIKKSVPEFNLYLCDSDKRKAEVITKKTHVAGVYSDFDEMLSSVRLDSVHILTPPSVHAGLAEKALLAGANVIIEKPPPNSTQKIDHLFNLAQEKGVILCVDLSLLGMPIIQQAIADQESGRLGKLVSIHCHFGASEGLNGVPYQSKAHWAYGLAGGVLENWACHPASLIVEVMEPITSHQTSVLRRNLLPNDCPDLIHVSVVNAEQIGSFTLSMGHGSNERHANLLFENGELFIDISRQLYSRVVNVGRQNFVKKAFSGIAIGASQIKGTMANFVNVATGRLTANPGIVNVVNSYYRAIASGDKLIVSRKNAVGVTSLMEKVWRDVGYNAN